MMAESKRPVILVVEDDPLVLTLATDMIAILGFEAIPASNADIAMAILEHGESVHVIFTDVKMPGRMNGIELARAVNGRWPNVRFLIASGWLPGDLPALPEQCRFLQKPYNLHTVENTLHELLA
jgi:CheY-like chemotaxis protein